ncbi:DUF2269 family protein [Wenzhouxiangella sediminis]|uniref:DUF2269 family protein n=1 Tax=Wenzhouxiangella sediminis TaxID=1792836 RepID=UPI001C6E53D3|nr:DUF2269 family protein [Wenzhouxiangella sediminis]
MEAPRVRLNGHRVTLQPVSEELYRLMRYWFGLGWPAFLAILGIFYLMVFKPVLA